VTVAGSGVRRWGPREGNDDLQEQHVVSDKISIDLLPDERAVLLKWTYPFADLKSQLASFGPARESKP
jgi:hypothetical protein